MPLYLVAFYALWLVACGTALLLGGAPERIVASMFLCAAVLSSFTGSTADAIYGSFSMALFVIDVTMLLLLVGLALASARFWPMAMVGMQGAEVLAHLATLVGGGAVPRAYASTVMFWSYPMLALLAVATWRHRRRLRRYGIDPGWAHDLPSSYRSGRRADERRNRECTMAT